jgi:hypothetical protein
MRRVRVASERAVLSASGALEQLVKSSRLRAALILPKEELETSLILAPVAVSDALASAMHKAGHQAPSLFGVCVLAGYYLE